jgi:photosystem II stability/assembly factor-like uncharacterized protein
MYRSARPFQILALLFLTTFSLTSAAFAASPHWVQATPFGGPMGALAVAPSSPQTVYAATLVGRFFRSLDGGATWSERRSGLGTIAVADLFVDVQDSRTVYLRATSLTAESEVQRTRNGGLTWTAVGPGPYVYDLTLEDRTPGTLYAATQNGLYRSANAGGTWAVTAFAGSAVFAFAIDPHDPHTFVAAVAGSLSSDPATFWRSTDQGATWAAASLGDTPPGLSHIVRRIVFDPAHAGTAYAVLGPQIAELGTLFRTTDDGASWSFLADTTGIRDLLPSPDGTLYAAADVGIARSTDRGDTWTPPLPARLTPQTAPRDILTRLAVSPASPQTLFATGTEGVWKSTNGGTSWSASNQGIVALGAYSLAAAPAGPDNLVAVAGDGIFRSPDQADTWRLVHTVFDGAQPDTIEAFDPHNPQTLYGIGFDGQAAFLARSPNGGNGWRVLPVGYTCGGDSICDVEMPAFAIDPKKSNNLFLGVTAFFHFQGFSEHILHSSDSGGTWKELTPLRNLEALAVDPKQGTVLYGLTCQGLFKSENTGSVWNRVGAGLPGAPSLCSSAPGHPRRLAVDPRKPQTLYVGTAGQGVFRSIDGGVTFRSFNPGLKTADITTVLVDPASSDNLYAAAAGKGVWRWDTSLHRWAPINDGLPVWDFAGALALDPQHPSILYAGTQTHGVYRLDLGK